MLCGQRESKFSEAQCGGTLQICGDGNAKVNCSEVQCEGACDASSAKVNLVRSSAKVLGKLVVKACEGIW